jgi:hypothetical protein
MASLSWKRLERFTGKMSTVAKLKLAMGNDGELLEIASRVTAAARHGYFSFLPVDWRSSAVFGIFVVGKIHITIQSLGSLYIPKVFRLLYPNF